MVEQQTLASGLYISSGVSKGINYIAMQRLGKDLESIHKILCTSFTEKTTL
jgi:hypothetical protein